MKTYYIKSITANSYQIRERGQYPSQSYSLSARDARSLVENLKAQGLEYRDLGEYGFAYGPKFVSKFA